MKKILLLICMLALTAISQTPQTLNYQGYLADSNGDPVNGSQNITFRIHNVSNGGSALWTEARTVTISDGVFSVVLGENTPINLPFDTQYWLGITVGGSELSPRTKLASSAYASNLPKIAFIKDVKANGVVGGQFPNGAWRGRVLNTLEGDLSFVSLSSNRFTLDAGTYLIEIEAPATDVGIHKARLLNDTDGIVVLVGTSAFTSASNDVITVSKIMGQITINSPKAFYIQHQCQTTNPTDGFGIASGFGEDEIYTQVKITKIAN